MFSYSLKNLRESCAPEECQEMDVDKIWTTFLLNIIKNIKNVYEMRGAGVYCYSKMTGCNDLH